MPLSLANNSEREFIYEACDRLCVLAGTVRPVSTDPIWTIQKKGLAAVSQLTATGGGLVTAVTATAPLLSSGGNTPDISMPAASGSVDGYLTAADWTAFDAKQPPGSYITALTGDVTAAGPGAVAATLANTAVAPGAYGSSTSIPSFTVDSKGRITLASGNVVIAPAGTLTGAVLAANVLASSLTSVGTLTGGATGAGFTIALGTSTLTGDLPLSNFAQASGASVLLGRGSAGGAGDYQEITLGSGLSMTGTVLASTGVGTTVTIVDDTTTNATMYLTWVTANTGNLPLYVTSTKLTYNPSTGAFSTGTGAISVGAISGTTGTFSGSVVLGLSGTQDYLYLNGQAAGSGVLMVAQNYLSNAYRPLTIYSSVLEWGQGSTLVSFTATGIQGALGQTTPAAASVTTLNASGDSRLGTSGTQDFLKISGAGAGSGPNLTALNTGSTDFTPLTLTGGPINLYARNGAGTSTLVGVVSSAGFAVTGGQTITGANGSLTGVGGQLLKLQGTNADYAGGIGFYYSTTTPNAAARAWQISPNYVANGNLDFLVSASNATNPSTAVMALSSTGLAVTGAGSFTYAYPATGFTLTSNSASAHTAVQFNNSNGAIGNINTAGTGTLTINATTTFDLATVGTTRLSLSIAGAAVTGALTVTSTVPVPVIIASTGAVTAIDLQNTHANDWGSNIAFGSNGTQHGFVGLLGSLLGTTDHSTVLYANTGQVAKIYANGNNLVATFSTTGVGILGASISNALDVNGHIRMQGGNRGLKFNNGSVEFGVYQDAGATAALTVNANMSVVGSVAVPSASYVYLDGGGDTGIRESSANNIQFVAAGSAVGLWNTTSLAVTGAFSATGQGKLQTGVAATPSLLFGADTGATTITNSTEKRGKIATPHYNTAEEDFLAIFTAAQSTANILYIGGGQNQQNAATEIDFFIAASNTTVTGSQVASITSTGLAITGVVSTSDPAGGAGPAWKLGVAATVSPTSPNRTIRIDIAGTSYYLAAKTTND